MTHQVTLTGDNTKFSVADDQTILQAAINAGVRLPYGCNNGQCYGCLQEITSGETTYQEEIADVGDLLKYQAMLCRAYAQSDVTINCAQLPDLSVPMAESNVPNSNTDNTSSTDAVKTDSQLAVHDTIDVQQLVINSQQSETFPVKVTANELLCDNTRLVDLQLPSWVSFDFTPGQYLDVLLDNGEVRSFSIVKSTDDVLSLYIKRIDNGFFTGYVFDYLSVGTIWRVQAPLGSFVLRNSDELAAKPILMLAGSTGIVPLLAMLQSMKQANDKREVLLYWGQRNAEQLYFNSDLKQLAQSLTKCRYIPVLSRPDDSWVGASGYVQDVAVADCGDLSNYAIYISGSQKLVNAATTTCLAANAQQKNIFLDVFSYQSNHLSK